jgi:ferredoxin
MARELRVDWLLCDGYGLCGDLAPDLIELDDWRYPIVPVHEVPRASLDDAQRAVDCCPMRALRLVDPAAGGGRRPARGLHRTARGLRSAT